MARQASRSIHIGYYHKPLDGKTPIFDVAANKWTYAVNPSEALITASVGKLDTVEVKATSALTKAELSENKAIQAQQTADSKVTAEEATEAIKSNLFFISRYEGGTSEGAFWNAARLELYEDKNEKWSFRVHCRRQASAGDSNLYQLPLDYATADSVGDLIMQVFELEQRIAAIEKKLGIS